MKAKLPAWIGKIAVVMVRTAAAFALIASLMVVYAKIYFWGGTRYAPIYVDLAIWSFIAAGPLAAWLPIKRVNAALLPLAAQIAIFCLGNWS